MCVLFFDILQASIHSDTGAPLPLFFRPPGKTKSGCSCFGLSCCFGGGGILFNHSLSLSKNKNVILLKCFKARLIHSSSQQTD